MATLTVLLTKVGKIRPFRFVFLTVLLTVIILGFFYKKPLTSFIELHVTKDVFHIIPKWREQQNSGSMKCSFPDIDPFNHAARRNFKIREPIICKGSIPSLISVGEDFSLWLNMTKVKLNKIKHIDYCKYLPLRLKEDTEKRLQKSDWSVEFRDTIQLNEEDEHVLVECYDKQKIISKDYINLIRRKKETEERCATNYKIHVKKNKPSETLSVFLVGMDGMSKQNLIRTMPKTREFILKNLQAIEFHGVNKVGLNTFPNIIALLTGYHYREALEFWSLREPLNKIDHIFIWDEYKIAGYRKAMMLDAKYVTAFHYLKKGWIKPPFDYNNRAMILKASHDAIAKNKSKHCVGDVPAVSVHLDYWLQLASAFPNQTTPFFAFNFFSQLTHDNQNSATAGDVIYLDFFQKLWSRNLLNNTILVFFSDHGLRFGSYRRTFEGTVEARSPFLFFMFPPWFAAKYPEAMSTIRINQQRLVTVFDVHETLRQLPSFKGETKKGSLESRGINLFDEIPDDRDCEEAAIPLKYCKCNQETQLNNDISSETATNLAKTLLADIVTKTDQFRNECHVLSLKKIYSSALTRKNVYKMIIETTPGDGLYEGWLNNTHVQGVSRINMYRGQAECVKEITARPFCYCKINAK